MSIPIVASELRALQCFKFAIHATIVTPVARLGAHRHMAEARCLSLAWVVATPVQEDDAQLEPACSVIHRLGMVLGCPSILPHEEVIGDGVHDSAQVAGLTLHTHELVFRFTVVPEVARYQSCEVRVPKVHGELIWQVGSSKDNRCHPPTAFAAEHRNSITHAHYPLVAGVAVHGWVRGHLRVTTK